MDSSDTAILMEFLRMPLDSSDEVFNKFRTLPNVIHRGEGLEQFLYVRGKRNNKVLLVAHADTFWDKNYGEYFYGQQLIYHENGIIKNENGCLGADDRAGCAMLWLLKNIGHSILITNGEEHGQRGSNWLMNENQDIANEISNDHQFVIQLDRRNGNDFKCYSVGTQEFRTYIEQVTGYSEPDHSSSTDIVAICRVIAGVNLSIGYRNEHRVHEYLVLNEWSNTLNICRSWLAHDNNLPKFRLNHEIHQSGQP